MRAAIRSLRIGGLTAAALLWASPGAAEEIRGAGAGISCADWMAQTRELHDNTFSWMLGFLSRATATRGDFLHPAPSSASLQAWLENYCRANPLEPIARATLALEDELVRRMPK